MVRHPCHLSALGGVGDQRNTASPSAASTSQAIRDDIGNQDAQLEQLALWR